MVQKIHRPKCIFEDMTAQLRRKNSALSLKRTLALATFLTDWKEGARDAGSYSSENVGVE